MFGKHDLACAGQPLDGQQAHLQHMFAESQMLRMLCILLWMCIWGGGGRAADLAVVLLLLRLQNTYSNIWRGLRHLNLPLFFSSTPHATLPFLHLFFLSPCFFLTELTTMVSSSTHSPDPLIPSSPDCCYFFSPSHSQPLSPPTGSYPSAFTHATISPILNKTLSWLILPLLMPNSSLSVYLNCSHQHHWRPHCQI